MQGAWSIRRRLPLFVAALLVAVSGALSWGSFATVRSLAEDAVVERLERLATQVAASVDTAAPERLLDSLEVVAASVGVRAFVAGSGDTTLVRDLLAQLVDASGDRGAGLWLGAGDPGWGPRAGLDGGFATAPPHLGDTSELGPLVEHDDTTYYYDAVAPVRMEGRALGAIVVRARVRDAGSQSMEAIMGPTGRLLIGNRDGSVWTSDGRRVEPPPASLLEATGPTRYVRNGAEIIGATTSLGPTPWIAVLEVGRDEALRPAGSFLRRMVSIAGALVTLGLIGSVIVARRMTAPLEKLATNIARVSEGDYRARVSLEPPREVAQLVATFNTMADHVEQRTAELMASRTRLKALVDATTHIVWFSDTAGNVDGPLPSWQTFTGQSDGEVEGAGWRTAIHHDDRARLERAWAQARLSSGLFTAECRIRANDGVSRLFLVRGVPVLADDGTVLEWAGTCTDIESQRAAERDLRRAESELRQAQKMEAIGRLAGGVAHDFNNLLTSILAPASFAKAQLAPEHPVTRELDDISDAALRAAELTKQLLTFSRQKSLQFAVLDLNTIVDESIKLIKRVIGEQIETRLALSATDPFVRADRVQVEQVILNLAINARDAMPNGGVLVIGTSNVDLGADYVRRHPSVRAGKYVLLSATDTGVGMDEGTLERIFEPFFTTKDPGDGTGLGLTTVHGIVQQAGGHVWAYSEEGHGTTFKVYLPLAEESHRGEAPAAPRTDAVVGGAEVVLLVEDDRRVRDAAVRSLELYGYEVLTAERGQRALSLLESREDVALVVTDMVMPGMSGAELAGHIRKRSPQLPILFLSGYAESTTSAWQELSGDEAFLQKPFGPESLAMAVRSALDPD